MVESIKSEPKQEHVSIEEFSRKTKNMSFLEYSKFSRDLLNKLSQNLVLIDEAVMKKLKPLIEANRQLAKSLEPTRKAMEQISKTFNPINGAYIEETIERLSNYNSEKEAQPFLTNNYLEFLDKRLKELNNSQTPSWVNYSMLVLTIIILLLTIFLR